MTTSHTAQGLASLGRNGDTMLVHMSPEEVGGLKLVGESLGIKMSTNPHTGMPEAFSFGDFFTSFLPTIVGAAVGGPAGAGFMSSTMTPILAGAGTGALLAAAKGDDPLMGGIMGGMGGYGGAGLKNTVTNAFGGTTAQSMGDLVNKGVTNLNPTIGQSGIVGSTGQLGPDMSFGVAGKQAADLTTQVVPNFAAAPNFTPIPPASTATNISQNLGELGSGIKNLTGFGDMSAGDAYKAFTDAGGSAMDLAMPVGGAVLAGLEPSDLGYGPGNLYDDPDKGKYRGPQGQLNLSDKYDTGLRLVAKGGAIKSYALGGAINTNPSVGGGLSDLYNRPEGIAPQSISSDAYGLGRLSDLGSEQARYQAQTLGYAMGGLTALKSGGQPGGYLDGEGDGMSDSIPATIEGKQPARLADGEFVIPADVVSHLGNGSSKAGSKRLYAMLDKVRHARTGNKKQGKEIKAEKYLPA